MYLWRVSGGSTRSAYVQDERYFAKEHMDVRREAFQVCTGTKKGATNPPK
jgi:hypothetical protein